MRPGEMDDVKKEDALDIGTPPGGPCRPALPGLFPIINFQTREFIIAKEMIEYEGPELRNEEIVWIVRWKKKYP